MSWVLPTSDQSSKLCVPSGPTSRKSRSSGNVCVRPVKVTLIRVIGLVKPLTATVWVTVVLSTNVMPVELVKMGMAVPSGRVAASAPPRRSCRARCPGAAGGLIIEPLLRATGPAFRQQSAADWLVILPAVGHRLAVPTAVQHPRTLADRRVCAQWLWHAQPLQTCAVQNTNRRMAASASAAQRAGPFVRT